MQIPFYTLFGKKKRSNVGFPLFVLLTIALFSNCTSNPVPTASEHIIYPGATLTSLTELMDAIEVVRLQHGDSILVDDKVRLLQRDSSFYLIDILGEQNIYRFASDGHFLNKIGQKGQGPEEFSSMLDIDIEEQEDYVHILSYPYCTIVRYAKDGTFKAKNQINVPTNGFCRTGKGYWLFAVYDNRTLFLRLDDSLRVTDSVRLTQYFSDRLINPYQKFTSTEDQAYFWQFPFPIIYGLTPDSARQTVFFDFKDQYIPSKDIPKKEIFEDKKITCISKYWENNTHILAEIGVVEHKKEIVQNLCGLKNKALGQWQWIEHITTPEKPFIPDWYPTRVQGFSQDGRIMCFFFGNEIEELPQEALKLITNPLELENIDLEMDMFVLLCHFK